MNISNYNKYTVSLSTDRDTYGEVSDLQHTEITRKLAGLILAKFPGVVIKEAIGSALTTGPDEQTCAEIDQWIAAAAADAI